ncbi:helix-turn-helix domain-containing protein [Fenollaria massiliensis]|nr:helix-turn-helix domain-containing protein [Fenollaria massiliensis]
MEKYRKPLGLSQHRFKKAGISKTSINKII